MSEELNENIVVKINEEKTTEEKRSETIKLNREKDYELAYSRLSEREKTAFTNFKTIEKEELTPQCQIEFFSLYMAGKNTEEIQKINSEYTLGQIVSAKLRGKWDKRKDSHLDNLLDNVQGTVYQRALESIHFTSDMLAATHKLYGDKIKRYIQTGKEEELEGFKMKDISQYAKCIDLLHKLTGQSQQNKRPETQSNVKNIKKDENKLILDETNAADIMKRLLGDDKKDE